METVFIAIVSGLLFFLSLWIVLPAPNLFFLRLAVGAPEISPLLCIIAALLLGYVILRRGKITKGRQPYRPVLMMKSRLYQGVFIALLVTVGLSGLPLQQQPGASRQAEYSMAVAFPTLTPEVASAPTFSWARFFKGIPTSPVRTRQHIPFSTVSTGEGVLSLDLYQPQQPGKYPAVITIYGGSWQRGTPAESQQMSQYLAERGYVVVAIDYRHAPQYRFPTQLEDVQTALAFVSDRTTDYEIDPGRVALLGWSAGAHLALLAGFQPSSPPELGNLSASSSTHPTAKALAIQSIVDYYGPIDLAAGYTDPPIPDPIDVKQVLSAFIGGTPSEFPDAYTAASPITYATSATADSLPTTLLIYGGRDHLVEARFGKRLYDALIQSGNSAVWIKIPWAEHAFDKIFNGVSNQLALHYVERFLSQTLK